ncbi:MAG: hypothetical protein ABL929_12655 [Ferruginibacter sp.]
MPKQKYLSTKERQSSKSWLYPEDLVSKIKEEIKLFYTERNVSDKLTTTPGNYELLKNYIIKSTNFEIKEVWLRDFYCYRSEFEEIKKIHFNSLLTTFNYDYNEVENKWEKLPATDDLSFYKIFSNIKTQLNIPLSLNDFVGKYKYFIVTSREPNYSKIYENELEIFRDRTVKIYNPFLDKYYFGIAFLRNHNILQIVSTDFNELGITSIGNLITFKVNEYKKLAILFPGIAFSFDGESNPMAAQSLLCSEIERTKTNDLIVAYFDKLAPEKKYSCPSNREVEELRFELQSKKSNS